MVNDATVVEVHGYAKQGASFGYTGKRGYHPLLATRADTGEVLHIRARKGSANTARGALRFVEELIPRVQRAGATGPKLLRADSGFWNKKLIAKLERAGWEYSIGVRRQGQVPAAIAAICESDWRPLEDCPAGGEAQIAETQIGDWRLVVRRTRLLGAQAVMWPDWRHFAFITNRTEPLELVEVEHRAHAVVELAIRDLKDQALAHFPSGRFTANAAWTVIAALAHNLLRRTQLLTLPAGTIRTARTLRRRLITIPGRLTDPAAGQPCDCRPAGPGPPSSSPRSDGSGRCRRRPEPAGRPRRPAAATSPALGLPTTPPRGRSLTARTSPTTKHPAARPTTAPLTPSRSPRSAADAPDRDQTVDRGLGSVCPGWTTGPSPPRAQPRPPGTRRSGHPRAPTTGSGSPPRRGARRGP